MDEQTPSVDGVSNITTPAAAAKPVASVEEPKTPPAMKAAVLAGLSVPYAMYVFWCFFLLSTFPVLGGSTIVIMIGVLTTVIGGLALAGIGAFGFMRISASKALPNAKLMALIKLGAYIVPGVLLSVVTPIIISGEPALSISITNPSSSAQLVAPLSISFSVQPAVDALMTRGFKPIQYNWDINGDKKPDQQTLSPELTATFDKEGIYTVSVALKGSDGTVKNATKRFVITRSVFSVTPLPAIVNQPVVFNLSNLYPKPEDVTSVAWDYDGDGKIDDANGGIQTSYTYVTTGSFAVTAVASLANKTQVQYSRTIDVVEPEALPFPISIKTTPEKLIGTEEFTAMFSIETQEPLYGVQWNFGDGQKAEGESVTHTFGKKGSYSVTAKVRAKSGATVDLNTVVKIVDPLQLNDLHFDGPNLVVNNAITGDTPLTLDLTPITAQPFVTFSWEAPGATEVGSTDNHLQAIYRKAGSYVVTLVGQDSQDHVLRQPITVTVKDPAPFVKLNMSPESGGMAPLSVDFDASDSNVPNIAGFIWNFGDGTGDTPGVAIMKNHVYTVPKNYTITVTAITTDNQRFTDSKTLLVRPPEIQARILASRLSIKAGESIEFRGDSSVGGPFAEYLWDFKDGTSNTGSGVVHVFLTPKNTPYEVTLTVTDMDGKKATTSIPITVQ